MQARVEQVLRDELGSLVMPAPVSAEVDYLLGARLGGHARRRFLEDLAAGRFSVECLAPGDYATVRIWIGATAISSSGWPTSRSS